MMSGNQQGEIAKGLEGVVAAETKIGFKKQPVVYMESLQR